MKTKHFKVAGKIGSTVDNLKDAVAGETNEYKDMYPDFVKEARTLTKLKKSSIICALFAEISRNSSLKNAASVVFLGTNLPNTRNQTQ